MSLMILSAATERKRQLMASEDLERATGKGTAPFEPGERWRNDRMYLIDDATKDGNGNPYTALQPSRNKPPANSPDFWEKDTQPEVLRWSDIAVGTDIPVGLEVIHNSQNWVCGVAHTKTAGNGPRQGSATWIKKEA